MRLVDEFFLVVQAPCVATEQDFDTAADALRDLGG